MDVADPVCEGRWQPESQSSERSTSDYEMFCNDENTGLSFPNTLRLTDHALQSPHCTGINTLRTLRRFFTFSSVVQKKRRAVY